jgi:hypothetical protein
MLDIYLYPGEPNPADVKLSDPTILRGGVAVTGVISQVQEAQDEDSVGVAWKKQTVLTRARMRPAAVDGLIEQAQAGQVEELAGNLMQYKKLRKQIAAAKLLEQDERDMEEILIILGLAA